MADEEEDDGTRGVEGRVPGRAHDLVEPISSSDTRYPRSQQLGLGPTKTQLSASFVGGICQS